MLTRLYKHAFGNYKELLKEITYTPAMANFLTYFRNRDNSNQNPLQTPDENYAREFYNFSRWVLPS